MVEFRSSVTAQQSYDSNVLSDERDERDDMISELAPQLTLRARNERGSVAATGNLRGRKYWDIDALDAVDRGYGVEGDYWLTPRLQVTGAGRSYYTENTDGFVEDGRLIFDGAPDLETTYLTGGLRYLLSPRTTVTLYPSLQETDFGSPVEPDAARRTDSSTRRLTLGLDRIVSSRDSVGFSLTGTDNVFERDFGQPDSESQYAELSFNWNRAWSPMWTSGVSLGATRVSQDAQELGLEALPGATVSAPDPEDSTLSGVGEISVARQTPWTTLRFSASQEVSPSSGFGTDLTTFFLSGRFDWRLNNRWTLSTGASFADSRSTSDTIELRTPIALGDPGIERLADETLVWDTPICGPPAGAIFTGRTFGLVDEAGEEVVDEVTGNPVKFRSTGCVEESDSAVDFQQTGFDVGLNWRTTKRFSTFLSYRYVRQRAGGETDFEDYNRNLVSLGFTYRYDVDLY